MDASRIKEEYTRPIERVIDRLASVVERNGSFVALCPAHPDRQQSLSVSEGHDGRALLNCFAGCETPEIVKGLGLDMRDLFADERREIRLPSTPRKTSATAQPRNPALWRTTPKRRTCPSSSCKSRASGTRSTRADLRYASPTGTRTVRRSPSGSG